MSTASQTKIFGIRLAVDPKILIGGLIVVAAVLFWYNSRDSDETGSSSAAATRPEAVSAPPAGVSARTRAVRRRTQNVDRGDLRIRAIDATHGDIDPTLRLDLIRRLQSVQLAPSTRSLFEIGPSPQQAAAAAALAAMPKGPKIPISSPMPTKENGPPMGPVVNIPLKFYGFVKPATKGENNRGLFLEGDNILVASEGELLDHRYLVVELTPNNARMEDTSVKLGQTLPVVPEALQQ